MAFYNQNPNNNGGQGMNNPEDEDQQNSGLSLTSGIVNNASAPAANVAKPATSGMGAGFQSYAKANQGAAQNNLSQAAASNVQRLGQQASTSINQATNKFGQKVDAGSLKNRQQAVQDVANAVQSARQITAPQTGAALGQVDQDQVNRFKEVINSRYQGPESLRQAGLYTGAADKVSTAVQANKNAATAAGREELLRSMYEKRGDYTRGLNKLDTALLNSNKQGVQGLQNAVQAQGNHQDNLNKAQIASANLSQNRAQEIKGIQEQARNAFSEGKKAEEAATDARLSQVVKDWEKLPEYFRDVIRSKANTNKTILDNEVNKFKSANADAYSTYDRLFAEKQAADKALSQAKWAASGGASAFDGGGMNEQQVAAAQKNLQTAQERANAINSQFSGASQQKATLDQQLSVLQNKFNPDAIIFNPFEAGVLGVQSGEGLYNLGADAIKSSVADKTRLVSKDEQARQAALAALAGLDQSNRLDTNLLYSDAAKAGTQTAADALDLAATRAAINSAEQNFRDTAQGTNLTGHGSKKVSRGNAFGKKTKTYTASVGGNVGDFLEGSGYDLDAPLAQGQDPAKGRALLDAALAASNTKRNGDVDIQDANKTIVGGAAGAATGAQIGSLFGGVGAVPGAIVGGTLGQYAGSGTMDNLQSATDILNAYAPGVGKSIQDARTGLGNLAGSVLGKGIGGAVGGINSSAMRAFGESIAKESAIKDLERQYTGFLDNQGFDNRVAVANADAVTTRLNALQQLLASMDKANSKV
jgi:hypothetical protein